MGDERGSTVGWGGDGRMGLVIGQEAEGKQKVRAEGSGLGTK